MISDVVKRWHEVEPLIDRLFDVSPAERAAWLRTHCDDATLRSLVARALDNAPGVKALERGVAQWLPTLADNFVEALPAIPGYRVMRFIGAGGMASVFEAERELPGGPQTVALKLLRFDVHDADERRRFMREQRILARLQHPHIAQLLDAGFTPAGTPFLALEFVSGENLVTHCEQHELATRERLALFINVCAAVEHAHRSLIVHRDLKPNNVLVGADGCVKLVDFGIAKLLTGEDEQTRTEARRLTRAYAAPEQFADDTATTAIDVYALGVLLAVLMSGVQPRRVDGGSDVNAPAFDGDTLRRKLGPDLHAIVQVAIRPDPIRRYANVAALREDVQRYLDGKPVQARADAIAYRICKFVRRNALAVSAGVVIATTLAGATAVGLHEAHLARLAAQFAYAQAHAAEGEAQRADVIKSFLEGLFDRTPRGNGTNETAEDMLAHARKRADRDFAKQPALHAEVLALVGDLERRSGHPNLAQQPLEQAAALANAEFGSTDARTLHIEYLLAKEADELGHVREGTYRLQQAVAAFELGPNRGAPEEVQALAWLAGMDERSGDSTKAIDIGKQALALARRVLPHDSAALTEAVTNLGWIMMDAGHPVTAQPLLREALARKRKLFGARHANVADGMAILASDLVLLGRYYESEQLMREAVGIDASAFARPNAHLAWHLNNLANVFVLEGRFGEARAYYAKSLVVDRALGPAASLNQSMSVANLARLDYREGDFADAEARLRDAIANKQRLLGADYDDNGRNYDRASLAEILIARGHFDEARGIADDALAEARRQHTGAHPDIAFALTVEARLNAAGGAPARGAVLAGKAVGMYAALSDQASDKSIRAHLLYGDILQTLGRNAEAKLQLQSSLAAASVIVPAASALIAHTEAELALADASMGDRADAVRLCEKAKASLTGIETGPSTERDVTARLLARAGAEIPEPLYRP